MRERNKRFIGLTVLLLLLFVGTGIIFFSLTFTIKQVVGLVVAFFGGILLLYNGGISPNYNVYFSIFIFFTTVGYGASVNLIKTYLTEISPSAVTAGIFLSILPPAVLVLFYSDFFVLFLVFFGLQFLDDFFLIFFDCLIKILLQTHQIRKR